MTAQDMEESMLHPTNRHLEVLTIEDAQTTAEALTMLMGPEIEGRREFLFNNVDFSKINT
nr:MAG TPA: DNA topoisomerase IV subunit B [Caudoviricetes sp.]